MAAADALQQPPVQLPNQPKGEGKRSQALHSVFEGRHIVANLPNIVRIVLDGPLSGLFQENLRQVCSGPFDPRGKDRLPPHIGTDQQVRVRK